MAPTQAPAEAPAPAERRTTDVGQQDEDEEAEKARMERLFQKWRDEGYEWTPIKNKVFLDLNTSARKKRLIYVGGLAAPAAAVAFGGKGQTTSEEGKEKGTDPDDGRVWSNITIFCGP